MKGSTLLNLKQSTLETNVYQICSLRVFQCFHVMKLPGVIGMGIKVVKSSVLLQV